MSLSTKILKAFIGASLLVASAGTYVAAEEPTSDAVTHNENHSRGQGYIGLGGGLVLAGVAFGGLKTQQAVERCFGP